MKFLIRPAEIDDAEEILAVLNPIILAGNLTAMTETYSVGDQIEYMRTFPARGAFLVAINAEIGQVLGLQSIEPINSGAKVFSHVCAISTFVSLEHRRLGIGASLSKATFAAAKELGYLKICANIRGDNPAAVAFYLSQGFRIIGTAQKHAFIGGKFVDEVLAEKFLAK